ncbi:hypothetical protein HMPREF1982_02678 [Clostridiales bacterium oral taxon 876 str. F0540]|nr:hypothetical protein HMPREF1982_02678 [Clostridiales bacterium oral taxon 876 str. F0540]
MVDKLKIELYEYIQLYGLVDERTVVKSQELDLEINKEMIS